MAWDELLQEIATLFGEIKQTLGFGVGWIVLPFVILFAVIVVLKITTALRTWWLRPYASPRKLLLRLAKIRGLSTAQLRCLKAINPSASVLIQSQMLLDPSIWPKELKSPREVTLFQSLFPGE